MTNPPSGSAYFHVDSDEAEARATFAVIDRATHGWPTESPDLLAALIDDWLERIEKAEQSI